MFKKADPINTNFLKYGIFRQATLLCKWLFIEESVIVETEAAYEAVEDSRVHTMTISDCNIKGVIPTVNLLGVTHNLE